MKIFGWAVFVIVQILFIPLAVLGVVWLAFKEVWVSKKRGISATAASVLGNRWVMHHFGLRNDKPSVRLLAVLPNQSTLGLWLLIFPSYLLYKITGTCPSWFTIEEEGKESVVKSAFSRTRYFDNMIEQRMASVEQFVFLGAGLDTRAYGMLRRTALRIFELDREATQRFKREFLGKAHIDASNVTFVPVDFAAEDWFRNLFDAGYDANSPTIFLLEGVTPYLSDEQIHKTLREVAAHTTAESTLLLDVYSRKVLVRLHSSRTTGEGFQGGLEFGDEPVSALRDFVAGDGFTVIECHVMGAKTKAGASGIVSALQIT